MTNIDRFNNTFATKSSMSILGTIYRGIWAGAFIAFGALLYASITSMDTESNLYRLLGAISFSLGLNLVVFCKSQLFTGNNLMICSLMSHELSWKQIIRNWFLVYFSNLFGSLLFVTIVFGLFGVENLLSHFSDIAIRKTSYSFDSALIKAIYCNILVCIAIWFAIYFKNTILRIIGIIVPITAFVYFGFEHSVANMFFVPMGLVSNTVNIHFTHMVSLFLDNIIPVTIGNIIGGGIVSVLIFLYGKTKKAH